MRIISVYVNCPFPSVVHRRLDEVAERFLCVAKFFSLTGVVFIECRQEDAAAIERMIADLV